MRSFRLLIVQPYLPAYRVGFFERLIPALAADSVTCLVSAGAASSGQVLRGDSVDAAWVVSTKRRQFKAFGATFSSYGSSKAQRGADGVIVGLQGSSLDSSIALISHLTGGKKVGVWGHIRSYIKSVNAIDQEIERWQARHADHIFAYTDIGSQQARKYGVAPERITTVMNSVDVSTTRAAIESLSADEVEGFRRLHGLQPGKTACFIGGLDRVKRVDFLQQALDEIWRQDAGFKLLVGGAGSDAALLAPSIERGQAVMLGYAGPREKALLATCSSALAMPGRVGLVAVESLAMGLPIVTTDWPFHAPEYEYLEEGDSVFTAGNTPFAFAQALLEATRTPGRDPQQPFPYPTVSNMVSNFHRGVMQMIH